MSTKKGESFVWTDDEVELLLNVTLQYKVSRQQEKVDWESCYTKYGDILKAFFEKYPTSREASRLGKDFPHTKESLNKLVLTTKLKNVRANYRRAVTSGRRSGHGRVVWLYFRLCEQVWGGSPVTQSIPDGVESSRLCADAESLSTTPSPPEDPEDSDGSAGVQPATVLGQRRNALQARLQGYRHDRLKRKTPSDIAQEELEVKKRMLHLMERSDAHTRESLDTMTANITQLTATITEGFALLRQMMQQPPQPPYYAPQPQAVTAPSTHGHNSSMLPPHSSSTLSHSRFQNTSVVCKTGPGETEPTTVLPDPACGETPIKEEEMGFVVKEEEEEKRVFK